MSKTEAKLKAQLPEREFVVITEDSCIIGGRSVVEKYERRFYIRAKTARGARKAACMACVPGRILRVETANCLDGRRNHGSSTRNARDAQGRDRIF